MGDLRFIQVLRRGWYFDYVKPQQLDRLIEENQVVCFFRKNGMAIVGESPLRGSGDMQYSGKERRTSYSIKIA